MPYSVYETSMSDMDAPENMVIQPRNGSWITKVRASSWRTWQNKKMSHHHRGDHEFFYFTMHTKNLHVCFAPNCRL